MRIKPLHVHVHGGEIARHAAHIAVTLMLSAGKVGGIYNPWALAAVAVSGGQGKGLCAALGAALGAYLFCDFQTGLRLAASAVLIYCANMAFCGLKITKKTMFAPCLSAAALLLVQSVYLIGRTPRHWALCCVAAIMTAAAALMLGEEGKARDLPLLCVMTAVVCAAAPLSVEGFSPGRAAAVWLVLLCAGAASPAAAAVIGLGVGLAVDLSLPAPTLLLTVLLSCGGGCAALLHGRYRWLSGGILCLLSVLTTSILQYDHGAAVLYESFCGGIAYAVLPRRYLPSATAATKVAGEREAMPDAVPAMVQTVLKEGAEAYRALYDELLRPAEKGVVENPSVIFDGAAEEVCRGCVLAQKCWQQEYDVTYSAFNDAAGPILRRGKTEPSDFPLHFSSRCVHFSQLLSAVDRGVYAYLLRRQYRTRLGAVRTLAREQYAQMGQSLCAVNLTEGEVQLRCRIGTSLRAKDGETVCGDQLAVFTVGNMLYMLLSDGMGSGEAAHAESAMTVRLLRKFLKAGIEARAALKTLNTALTLRCDEGGGFTTIDLLALDRSTGEATVYKYGAAPSYVKRGETVARIAAGSLPAGLQGSTAEPEHSRLQLQEGALLVMVSDGVVGGGDENWLSESLRQWGEMDVQDLSQQILAESRRHGGLQDDCAALVMRLEKAPSPEKNRV